MAAAFTRIYREASWLQGARALSGLGSQEESTRPFCHFLGSFLRGAGIASVVDVGCGHWPSGYQRFLDWADVAYVGVEVVPSVVRDCRQYFARTSRLAAHGLRSARFEEGDAACRSLPPADLLLVKDVLMHWPNEAVHGFLQSHVYREAPRYRYVMLVQNESPMPGVRALVDIESAQLLPFDIRDEPFQAPFENVFAWESDQMKSVQLWRALGAH